jgi:hypothetical protein
MLLELTALCLSMAGGPPASAKVDRCEGDGEGAYRVVELRSAEASLVLFGARHRTDPADPIVAELEQRVTAFSPSVILVEGPATSTHPSRKLAIEHGGEMGLLCWIASQRNIPCLSTDVPDGELARQLLRRHAPDEVLLFLTVRALATFNPRPPSQRPPGDLVAWSLQRYGPLAGLPQATKRDLARVCQRVLLRPWDPGAVTTAWHDPRKAELLTQRMSRESDGLREPYMLDQMLSAARSGARVFVALGEGHVCNMRDALRARWNDKRTRRDSD